MDIIKPITVTDSVLTSTNIAENDYAEWNSGTTYAIGDKVISVTTHRIYESVTASNLNNDPTTDDGTNWLNIGATNRWKAFDQHISDPVSNTTSIQYTLTPPNGSIPSAVALLNLKGISANVTVTDSVDGEVYNTDIDLLDNRNIVDWYTYFFEEQVQREEALFLDIPPYIGAVVSVTVQEEVGQTAELGQLIFGFLSDVGFTVYGTSIGIEDYSIKDRDAFGNAIIVERNFSQTVDFDVQFETQNARKIQKTLAALRATPVVYLGSTDVSYGTLVYGFYRRFDITLETPAYAFASIEVEGLT
tara:strand:- start:140 stop:1048 length:909 start_codon:yes stop_codon:yes gene_type:complete